METRPPEFGSAFAGELHRARAERERKNVTLTPIKNRKLPRLSNTNTVTKGDYSLFLYRAHHPTIERAYH